MPPFFDGARVSPPQSPGARLPPDAQVTMIRASHLGAPTRCSTMLEGTSKAVYPMKKMAVPIAYT